ncbi:hypothetical protein JZ751_016131 [Albula glossodonta]|uniref:Apoptosis facilitator Bcl-2-like protein 14 n=1 Tax=Albula glossodonta TaxID=121402 RepID=A0A8T2NRD9_9TELE|nr:hypothetical protein JZ751_016131 [Albula glossodonta]
MMENGSVTKGMAEQRSEDAVEFRLLMAYAQRRRPAKTLPQQPQAGDASPPSPKVQAKKKTLARRLRKVLLACVRPQRDQDATAQPAGGPEFRTLCPALDADNLAGKICSIVESVDLSPLDIVPDGLDDVIEEIVDLLRESGDELDKKIREDNAFAKRLRSAFTYTFFEKIANLFLQKVAPCDIPVNKSLEQAKIALTFDITSKLTAVDCHPMNMVLGFGAKYLKQNFSTWVQQHGGWEGAFDDDEEEDQVE